MHLVLGWGLFSLCSVTPLSFILIYQQMNFKSSFEEINIFQLLNQFELYIWLWEVEVAVAVAVAEILLSLYTFIYSMNSR